jgi:hypothetical protein
MFRLLRIAAFAPVLLGSFSETRAAVLLTFGSYTWDQANVPNTGKQLGVNDTTTRSGASFGPANDVNQTRTGNVTGFIESQAGANTGIGYLSRITQRKTSEAPAVLETTGTRAINIPQSGNINASIIRRGVQVGWNAGTNGFVRPVMTNGAGTDLVIWESGDHAQPDAMMTRVRNATTLQFTDWYFFTPSEYAVSGAVLFGFGYDLSNFGIGAGVQVDLIEMANMVSTDRIYGPGTSTANGFVAQGRVRPEAGGAYSLSNPGPDPGNISPSYGVPFGNATYDPDPLYVSVLGNLQNFAVPEPASFIAWSLIIGFGTVGAVTRRTWKS